MKHSDEKLPTIMKVLSRHTMKEVFDSSIGLWSKSKPKLGPVLTKITFLPWVRGKLIAAL